MKIHGLQKLTLLDYPEHLAAVLFTGSCNFRCPFCQNGSLVLDPSSEPVIPEADILAFLKKRIGILDGVCITGGEPTLHSDLPRLIRQIKALGYLIKLDTNGTNPAMVKYLSQEKLLDYVAMDIKASRQNYGNVSGCPQLSLAPVQETIDFLIHSGLEYEFRTTAVKGLHTLDDFEDIAEWLAGDSRYYIQNYRSSDLILQRLQGGSDTLASFSTEEMQHFLSQVRKHLPNACLRGVDET